MPHKSKFMTDCRHTTLVLICSAASEKNDCVTANELLKPSTCEAQIDLTMAPIKREHWLIENI